MTTEKIKPDLRAMQLLKELCFDAGMSDTISKPIRVEELVAAVKKVTPGKS